MAENVLARRLYLIKNREKIFKMLLYYKAHHINFEQTPEVLWELDNEEGTLSINDVAT